MLVTFLTQLGYAGPLDPYRGVNRLIVVSMPQGLDKWFVLIDGMPMRRREIQNQRKENH